ncbi:hypothetical protein BDU57DRAFT_535059 [Ampelomyces quisqualis]|uniref:ADF-H domain-containing protein n=1 Tax=Ampelomyces quisqualis TaxID=50730 RepID=A0A6A5QZY0_AMPQU|nr:hypothetical protein BDU57DRAFT_535059 [Ampelomyces quisqualis]
MSLHGLDSASVTQAYQGALAEAGGWFLLKYASRDTLEMLTRGTGGAGEARAAVAQYDQKSPLYGFMRYRRRKVLVKYVPEGTSRVLQARVSVHFLTIAERFAPHDFVLSISTPEELSDAALTAACTLHTAAPSTSSSCGSLRQPKLSGIQEAAEEGSQPGGHEASTASPPGTAKPPIPTIMEPVAPAEDMPERVPQRVPEKVTSTTADRAESAPPISRAHENKAPEAKPAPDISHVTVETVTEAPTPPDAHHTDMADPMKSYDQLFENGPGPRASTQTTHPSYTELYEHYHAQYSKPKVKLGPRPRPSLDGRRPSTSGNVPHLASQPKSSLPAGLRSSTRKAGDQRAPIPRDSGTAPTPPIPPPPPIPPTIEPPTSPVSLSFTARIPASVRSMPVSGYSSHHRSTGMTQEKTRLMKALELRKKHMKFQVERQEKIAKHAAALSQAEGRETEAAGESQQGKPISTTEPSHVREAVETKENRESGKQVSGDETSSTGPAGSGSVFPQNHADTDDLISTASAPSPISGKTHGSSGTPSTRPSSLSEDDTSVPNEECLESSDSKDEEASVDSLPTVVPENRSPIPSVIQPIPPARDREQASLAGSDMQSDEGAKSLMQAVQFEVQARRRSNRESMLFVPPGGQSPMNDPISKRRARESIIIPTSKRQSGYETKEKRLTLDPIQVSAENSEAEYLSDDSFMEELQSATVHEAKPMLVSKSPATPWFPRKTSDIGSTTLGRSASHTHMRASRESAEQLQLKTPGPWSSQLSVEKVGVGKKMNVSTGISQRIKALAENSSRELSPPVTPGSSLDASSHSLAQRKSSFFATTPIEMSPNSRPVSRLGNPAFLHSSSSTPEKSSTVAPQSIKAAVYNVQRANEQAESVQVTARIVRDERSRRPKLAMPNEKTPLDLHMSPLIIDHQKPKWTPRSPTRSRTEPASPKAPSISHSLEQSTAPPRTSSESGWRPFSRRMSESKSIYSYDGGDDKREDKKEKKESRTSKMFKRMSSSMHAMPWKNSSNNLTLLEHDMRSTSLASLREPPPSVHVGELNVQFPDTLLWKRRWVEIDSLGNLVLSPSKSNEKGMVKRFHLSDFCAPYPPDQDRQELPNSVILDFVDGRTLQVSCETYRVQAQVLQILREAHDAWLAYNQAL